MELTKEQVLKFLPHRDPFLFIDSVESIVNAANERISDKGLADIKEMVGIVVTSNYFVRDNLEIFKGHFPGNPILPGVVQIEMMAQCSCFGLIHLFKSKDLDNIKLEVALLKVDNAKFRKPIRPNMQLKIVSKCVKVRGNTVRYHGQIFCSDEMMSEVEILATHDTSNQ
ncbi:MAG: beta-hydroxyacyl-ACP dehydratase [Oligoflexia bacterium]|nr:beta-hydroxyacyl-ACP dehydratase [Oligoflexia bacterium]